MSIQEFRTRFVSRNESSVLFAALRRLSLMNDLKSPGLNAFAWGEWPAGGHEDGECLEIGRA
ncbi:MAG TPA: hypothetical protein VF173_04695 [Thermoanaerobaculia bacterium]|nr:hypothetical protein [Thermoanaerobaculia bacterium]